MAVLPTTFWGNQKQPLIWYVKMASRDFRGCPVTNFVPLASQDVNDRLGEPYERFGRLETTLDGGESHGVVKSFGEDLRKGFLVGSMEVDEKMNRWWFCFCFWFRGFFFLWGFILGFIFFVIWNVAISRHPVAILQQSRKYGGCGCQRNPNPAAFSPEEMFLFCGFLFHTDPHKVHPRNLTYSP